MFQKLPYHILKIITDQSCNFINCNNYNQNYNNFDHNFRTRKWYRRMGEEYIIEMYPIIFLRYKYSTVL